MISDVYKLTPMQLGMLFHSLLDEKSSAYFEQVLFSLKGEIDIRILEKSFNAIIERYDILRTIFHLEDKNQPLQIVLKHRKTKVHFKNIDHLSKQEQERYLQDFMAKDKKKGFDLTRDMLMRLSLFKTGKYSYKLIWSFHHILMDGWCLGIIYKELSRIYYSLKKGKPLKLEPPIPYGNYIKWLETQDKEQGLKYWREYLEGVEEQTGMNQLGQRKSQQQGKYEVGTYAFTLDEEKTTRINKIAAENNTTVNTVFQTLWGILLQRYNNTNEMVYGIVVSGRPPEVEGIETMVGLFINTVPIRITSQDEKKFSQLLQNFQEKTAISKSYEYLPLAEIQAQSPLKNKLIDHIMVFENYPIEKQVKDNHHINIEKEFKLEVENVKAFEQTNYHFNIVVSPGKRLFISFNFNSLVFDREFIKRTASHFNNIVNQVAENPNILVTDIEIVTPGEKHQLLFEFNDTHQKYPHHKTIHQLFAAQVEQTPDNIAVIGSSEIEYRTYMTYRTYITYRELNQNSNQLASLLKEKGVNPDTIVAIIAGHSIEMIVGILGILKAGGAYLPIDPQYPQERINYMLKDSNVEVLVMTPKLQVKVKAKVKENFRTLMQLPLQFINLETIRESVFEPSTSTLTSTSTCQVSPANLAYTIYTSGSTGKPKGVIVEHQSLANLCCWHNHHFSVTYRDRATKYAGFGFDASVWEIFPYIIRGASLYIIEDQIKLDIPRLSQYFEKHHITISFLPTQVCEQFMAIENRSLRILLTGGDKLKRFVKQDYSLVNNYGPTENTVVATSCLVEPNYQDIPIGKPIFNNRIYILNSRRNLQPVGIPGELCIAGDSLARGYLNHPELTAKRFCLGIHMSYRSYMSYIYRTGDLAQWLPDGNILFIGRTDQQVKIRGYRIELGEIENQLMNVNIIKETVVLARENKPGEKYLCAYIVPHQPLEDSSLRETLSQHLPDYMIPSYFVQLEKLPLTPNGKIDRKALPEPEVKTGEDGYQAPGDDVEEKLVKVWAEVLLGSSALKETNPISTNDNFFNIGGDSIKAIQIAARLKKFGLKLEIKDLFANPTIKQLRKTITPIKRTIDQNPVHGEVQLTPVQQWFFENNFDHRNHFNQAVMIYRKEGFDENIVRRVFQQLIIHHDALRMIYQFYHETPQAQKPVVLQINRGLAENTEGKLLDLELFDLKQTGPENLEKEIQQEANRIQKSIDLEKGPLVKLGLFKTAAGNHLLMVIHHLVVDGISWRILLEDFAVGYQQAINNETLRFPHKTDSFKHWAQQLKKYAESPTLLSELEYWKRIEKTGVPPLPKDFEISPAEKKIKNLRSLRLTLNPEQTRQLLKEVNQAYSTEINDILLAAVGLAVKDWAEIDKVFIHLEGHGRQEIIEGTDISRTVGWFTNQYPVLLEMSHPRNLSQAIKHVKETLRQIPNKGIGHGILKYLTPASKKDGFAPGQSPEISFNYLGEFDSIAQHHQENMFRVSGMRTGNQFSPELEQWYTININGMIAQSQLVLDFSYNKYQYKQSTIEGLLDGYKLHLSNIIAHCIKKESKELTPSDLTYPHLSIDQLEAFIHQLGNIEDIYELTPMQSGMLFHALNNVGSTAYVEQMVFSIEGHIDRDLLKKSFNCLVERYEILRTLFYYEQVEQPLQIVLKHRPGDFYCEEIGHGDQEGQNRYLNEFYLKDIKRGFDLSKDMLSRVSLLKTGETAYKVIWTFHHILMDGWCTGIVFKELLYIYQRLSHHQPLELEPVTKYSTYIRWLKRQDKQEGLSYWQAYLEGYEDQTGGQVPTLGRQTKLKDERYLQGEYLFTINQLLTNGLNRLARENRVTLNTVLQSLWGLLLQRYNNINDVVFGAVVSGRPSEINSIEQMVGLFINTIPVRIKSNGEKTFSRLINEIQAQALKAKSYEYLPLADIQANSYLKGELIHHIMVFENYPLEKEVKNINETPGFYVQSLQIYEQTNYDFNIVVLLGRQLSIKFIFNSLVYEKDWVERISLHLEYIIEQVTRNPGIQTKEIEIMPAEEKQRLLEEFNDTAALYPADKTLHECFADQVEQTPDNIAVVGPLPENYRTYITYMTYISYGELNQKSNQLAGVLIERGVKPDTIVGIMADRSVEMIIGIFGILKAGGAYLPIDPQYPEERIQYMLKDSGAKVLLASPGAQVKVKAEVKENSRQPQQFPLQLINIDKQLASAFELPLSTLTSTSTCQVSSANLAYIIYTSGSTGKPKGVAVEHSPVVNLAFAQKRQFNIKTDDRVLQFSSPCFDASIEQIFIALFSGAALVLIDKSILWDASKFESFISNHSITHIHAVPSFLNNIELKEREKYHLRRIISGGDVCPVSLAKRLSRYCDFYNEYGPTETTVTSIELMIKYEELDETLLRLPIGRPIDNTAVYILDKWMKLICIGAAGELYIGGAGIARGYLNRPELTADRFCLRRPGGALFEKTAPPGPPRKNFLLGTKGTVQGIYMSYMSHMSYIYRTGDLARWLPDGNLEFLGRIDHQVKIRGFRIELGEIESQLLNHQQIQACAVLSFEENTNNNYLCAYIVQNSNGTFTQTSSISATLRQYLSHSLPDYMIPSYFILLEKLPLTPNGKLDRRALPAPGIETPAEGYQAPRDDVEEKLTGIWAEVLLSKDAREAGNPISINDNFFNIGGDSIKAIQIAARLQKFALKLEIKDLFENPTIKQLRKYIKHMKRTIDQRPVIGEVQLTPIQQWFFENNFTHPHHFNQAVMLFREQGFDEYIVKRVFQKLVEHHDALRMVYEYNTQEGVVIQQNRGIDANEEGIFFDWKAFDFNEAAAVDIKQKIKNAANRIQAGIHLEKGPLLKIGLFKTAQGDHLLIVIHHLVVDGVSWRILLEDFAVGYQQAMNHENLRFPPKTDSFKQWAHRLKQYAESHTLLNELEYWNEIEKTPITPLPKDFEISAAEKKIKNNRTLQLILDPEQTRQLLREVNRAYSTEINDIVLAALGLAVKDWAGIENVFFHLEGHGREEILEDIDITRTMGWFTSQFPVLLEMKHAGNLSYIIKHVKETLRRVPNKGIGYGILRYLTPEDKKDGFVPAHPPEISFNYLGEFAGFNQDHRENVFQGSEMNTGNPLNPDCQQTYTININGMILQSQLVLSFSYNKKQYKPHTIEGLLDSFKSHLLKIISHCVKKERKELTPSDLTYPHLSIDQLETLTHQPGQIKDIYELTPMQTGMLFHALKDKESTVYFEQMVFSIKGDIDKNLLQESFNHLVERYDILRTVFYYEGLDQPLQIVLLQCPGDIYFEDIAHLNTAAQNRYLKEFYLKDRKKGFDLTGQRLIRASLIKTGNHSYQLVWSFHHILMDGWCTGIIFNELTQIYNALLTGEPLKLEPVTQYVDYIKWLNTRDKQEGLKYWQEYLAGYESPAGLMLPASQTQKTLNHDNIKYELGEYVFRLDESLTAALQNTAVKNNATVNTVIQSIWGILLQRYNQMDDVVYGAVVSGRPPELEDVERMLGLFINTVPVRIQADGNKTFSQLINYVQHNTTLSKSYEYLPLAEIQSLSFPKGELIDHIMVFENYPIDTLVKDESKVKGYQFKVEDIQSFEQTNYHFNIIVIPGKRMVIQFTFNVSIYEKDFVKRISEHFTQIVKQVTVNPLVSKRDIEIIPELEKQRLLYEFNETRAIYPQDKTIHECFAEQVEKNPDYIAVVGPMPETQGNYRTYMTYMTYISYGELNQKSNQLAVLLREKGVKPDTIVGIMMERSFELIIGILGILKAGGAYLPIDPQYPEERIAYMLKDSSLGVLVTTPKLQVKAEVKENFRTQPQLLLQFINLETRLELTFEPSPSTLTSTSTCQVSPANLAYIIYTSGSTGNPKGVMIDHQALVNYICWAAQTYINNEPVNFPLYTSISFDLTVTSIFTPLVTGNAIVVYGEQDKEFLIEKVVQDNRVGIVKLTPSHLKIIKDTQIKVGSQPGIKKLILGGEDLENQLAKEIDEKFNSKVEIYNEYGPTETTVGCMIYKFKPLSHTRSSVPIGVPAGNVKIYLLDKYLHPVPLGVTGEIFISGAGVSRGYLNQIQLTAEKFLPDTFAPGSRMYRSGDLGRWLANENLEFLGRIDQQVKIRGFRIEPGEIENRLLNHEEIKQAAVTIKEDESGEKYLCAYVISKNAQPVSELKEYLSQTLPDYMIPAYFMQLDCLPLTANGKIDRKALPHPVLQAGESYVAPRNFVEKKLVSLWTDLLGVPENVVGIDHNFFELGGHSLKAISLIARIHREFNVNLPLSQVFKSPTIRKISKSIQGAIKDKHSAITPREKREYYELSSAQKRLYFLQQLDLTSTSYNIPLIFPLGKDINKDKLESTLKKLITRHEGLRTSFIMLKNEPVQQVHSEVEFEIEYKEVEVEVKIEEEQPPLIEGTRGLALLSIEPAAPSPQPAAALLSSFIRPFNLNQAPLIRSRLIKHPDNYYTWLVDIHHIVSDGTSQMILVEEFTSLYQGNELPPLSLQYKDFSLWQNRLLASGVIKAQEDYWLSLYQGEIPRLNLLTDYKRPEVFTFAGDHIRFVMEGEDAEKFREMTHKNGGTLYMNMLAALSTLFYKYTSQTDIIIGCGIAGRSHADLQQIIGMFVNTLVMRNYPQGEKTYETFLKEVINNSIKAFENQDVQFEDLVDRLEPERNPSRNPLFDISMVVQNFQQPGKTRPANQQAGQIEVLPKVNESPAPVEIKNPTSKFDMTFFIYEIDENIHINIEYYTAIFKKDTIKRLTWHFQKVTRAVIKNPNIKLKEIDIISAEEKKRVLYEFNDTGCDFPAFKTLHALFADQVEQTPDHIAVVQGESLQVTYRQLHEYANRIACYLCLEKGLKPGEPVGIWMSQLLMRPAAVLGILKAGGAYVPLEPSLPEQRLKYMIQDAFINIVISEKKYVKQLNRLQWECDCFNCYLAVDSEDIHSENEKERSELMDVELWHHVGETAIDDITAGGWISSYTGEPFSTKEMDEYGDNILAKLQPLLHPKMRVLEIGCASGITMYRIAPKVKFYYGTDLSDVIINRNKNKLKQEGFQNIKLKTLAAHEIHQIKNQEPNFHLIIINSVIQCFPGHNYLRKAIKQSIDLLAEKGYLFIGDIMDLEKKDTLLQELTDFKRNNRGKAYNTKTDFSSELFIPRGFWEDLSIEFNQVETIDLSNKIYTIENELTKFRYDVLITVNKRSPRVKKDQKRKHQDGGRFLTSPGPVEQSDFPAGGWSHYPGYIIYTSGTTGHPKGVMIEHASVVNLCYWHWRNYEITGTDHATLYAGFGFDASVWELFPYLLTGAVLYIVDESIRLDIEKLNRYFRRCHITISFLPTQMCEQFMLADNTANSLRVLLTGGDKLRSFTPRRYQLHNNYGPTENTVVTTSCPVKHLLDNIPIGKPIDNNYIYILDKESFHLQPIGIPGELCITGTGLARGYLNRPGLTAEKFCLRRPGGTLFEKTAPPGPPRKNFSLKGTGKSNMQSCSHAAMQSFSHSSTLKQNHPPHSPIPPFSHHPIYRTGDLARWLPDGNIEFFGRIDQQVKIRGFRIQLEEIENQIKKQEGIKDAVVITRENENADKYLCAYIVPLSNVPTDSIDPTLMQKYLAETLPDYMIPLHFLQLEKLPLTPGGKVDRKALPKPGPGTGEHYMAPGNHIQKKLTGIWAEILGLEPNIIGINHNFFDLGGHSLKATVLAAKIHKELTIKIPLVEIFKTPTIKELGEYINTAQKERFAAVQPAEKKEYYTLSSAQRRLYVLQQMEAVHVGYNMAQTIPLEENIDIKRLELAFKELIARHESLRTSFHMVKDEPVQKIHDEVEFKIENYKLQNTMPLSIKKAGAETKPNPKSQIPNPKETGGHHSSFIIHHSFVRPFDLAQTPLLRVMMINTQSPEVRLFIDMHHIITDGTSQNILKDELLSLYASEKPPALRLQYKDYAQWQNNRDYQASITAQQDYWVKIFPHQLPVLNLPTDFPRSRTKSFEGSTVPFILTTTQTKQIKDLSKKTNITLFTIVLTVFNVLLSKLSSQEDIIVGIPIMGRRHADLERIIGMFVNTLPLRNYPAGNKTFIDFLQEVRESTLEAFENQDYQFDEMVKQLAPERDTDRSPIFDVMFNFLNQRDYTNYTLEMDKQRLHQHQKGVSKFDLTLTAVDLGKNLLCSFEYCTKLFESRTIDRIIGYFKKIFDLIFENPGQKLSEIGIITSLEKHRILNEFNDTGSDYPWDKTISECFEQQVARMPNHIVVIGIGHRDSVHNSLIKRKGMDGVGTDPCVRFFIPQQQITYIELNQKANQLAQLLLAKGVKPDTIVAVMMERSVEMIVAILGILKAGGAYLPIDPNYPEEHIQYMLKDSNVGVLVTTSKLQVKVKAEVEENFSTQPQLPLQLLNIDTQPGSAFDHPLSTLTSTLTCQVSPASLAYVLYTSGSTGKPKGVMVNQYSVLRLVINTNFIAFDSRDRLLQTGALDFDASTFEIWGPLLNGALLGLPSRDDLLNPHRLKTLIREKNITIMWMTAPLFNHMLKVDIEIFRGLKSLLLGGDVLSPPHIRQIKEKYPQLNVINGYGPTENTTFSTTHPVQLPITGTIPIGKPIANSTAYILDKYDRLVPVGVTGELVVGGDGVARGYMNNPELTAEKFCLRRPGGALFEKTAPPGPPRKNFLLEEVDKDYMQSCNHASLQFFNHSVILKRNHPPHSPIPPFPHHPIYRTGDLGRWLSDGSIEFLGRQDFQVKIRGFRIEPGEIENRLLQHPQVREAVVTTRQQQANETNEKYLCAYIVPGRNQKPEPSDFRNYLAAQLPDYMVPAHFVLLERIPLTNNGKVQRNALPEPTLDKRENYTAPGNIIEKQLAAIWWEILCRDESIDINDNFFDLGGHSLKAAVLAAKIHQTFQVKIHLKEIFSTPTIKELAAYIARANKSPYRNIEKLKESDFYEPSYHQKRLWVLHQLSPESPAYHMPGNLVLNHEVDEQTIRKTVHEVVQRHESLRTGFKLLNDQPMQFILSEIDPPLQMIDISTMKENEKHQERDRIYTEIALKPFQLDQPPLFRSVLVKSGSRNYEFLFNVHHIISDGWSMEILKKDFYEIYEGYRKSKEVKLLPLNIQYKDFAAMHNQQLKDPGFKKEAQKFWKKKLQVAIPVLKFHGSLNKNINDKKGAGYQCFIDAQLKENLQKIAKENNTSLFMVMFSVYILFLVRFTGEQDIACSFISAGREHINLHNIIGFFVNSVIFRTHVDYRERFEAFLQQINKDILEIFSYQSYPLELVFEELQVSYPDIPVSFNMVNIQDATSGRERPSIQPGHVEKAQDVKFDLEPYIREYKNGIHIYWAYGKSLFTPKTIEYMASEYIKLLDYFASHPDSNYKTYRDRGIKPTFKKRR